MTVPPAGMRRLAARPQCRTIRDAGSPSPRWPAGAPAAPARPSKRPTPLCAQALSWRPVDAAERDIARQDRPLCRLDVAAEELAPLVFAVIGQLGMCQALDLRVVDLARLCNHERRRYARGPRQLARPLLGIPRSPPDFDQARHAGVGQDINKACRHVIVPAR